jgi:plastocyanin
VNKVVAVANLPVVHVKIKTDSTTTGTYMPHIVTVKVNQQVDFTNVADAVHTVTDDNGSFDSRDIATNGSGSTWTFRPTAPGTFRYFCKYHPLMHGVLVVKS